MPNDDELKQLDNLYERIVRRKDDSEKNTPLVPYENLLRSHRHWLGRTHHTRDFLWFLAVAVFFVIVLIIDAQINGALKFGDSSMPWIVTSVGSLFALYKYLDNLAKNRLGAIDLIAGEIVGIGRVFAAANIIGGFIEQYQATLYGQATIRGFADSAGKESYYTMYERSTDGLGSISPALLEHIALFYTFLKGARDATGALRLWNARYPSSQKRVDIVNIIYLCFLQILNGRHALENLIDDQNQRTRSVDIFLGIELQCFAFLLLSISSDDYRFPGLEARVDGYKKHLSRRNENMVVQSKFPYYEDAINSSIVAAKLKLASCI